ncbi:MAG: fibronectin type III domain-containing protein [Candidatus Marinimicrobia bacterium]|nr:fibronectin type III domain-containing protein [Candidatus Neomarinimicrobiota bacterium]
MVNTDSVKRLGHLTVAVLIVTGIGLAQDELGAGDERYIRIGELQNHFTAYGSERAWNNDYYQGLQWPADYLFQDNSVIKRAWLAVDDFTDADGYHWDKYGIYFNRADVGLSLFPIELKQIAKFEPPLLFVDGDNISAPFATDIDTVDPTIIPDRIINNVVNTSMGLTQTRRIYAFSQEYHDSYFIKEFIFKNTGNTDYDDEIELNATLKGVRIGWGTRYSTCRDGSNKVDRQQGWGKHTWISKRGEDYAAHVNDIITAANPIVEWIRCAFSWFGQSELVTTYDNIGAPHVAGDGRLLAPQFAGSAVLHVDKSVNDSDDDPNQPAILGWHAGDTYPSVGNLRPTDEPGMISLYDFLTVGYYPSPGNGGTDRMDENHLQSITDRLDPYTIHGDGGGTNVWITYGPFDIPPGDSIVIVEVEAVNGLNRTMCRQIGERWLTAHEDDSDVGPFTLPDQSTTDNEDIYKNSWFYTGIDSLLLTFSRAKRNYDMDFNIPAPPQPPTMFNVESGGDKISLTWAPSPSEWDAGFVGYKIYRGVGKPDTTYSMIADIPVGETSFDDESAIRGFSYYYYIVAYNDGSNNTEDIANPTGSLISSRFYTKTNTPARLKRKAGAALKDIRVVPNPFNIRAKNLQFPEEVDKIMFYDIPGKCTIKIFSERGDLINTIIHNDGSGDEEWLSVSSFRQVVVSGIYIAHIEVDEDQYSADGTELWYRKGETATRKIIIVR